MAGFIKAKKNDGIYKDKVEELEIALGVKEKQVVRLENELKSQANKMTILQEELVSKSEEKGVCESIEENNETVIRKYGFSSIFLKNSKIINTNLIIAVSNIIENSMCLEVRIDAGTKEYVMSTEDKTLRSEFTVEYEKLLNLI